MLTKIINKLIHFLTPKYKVAYYMLTNTMQEKWGDNVLKICPNLQWSLENENLNKFLIRIHQFTRTATASGLH